MNMLNVWIVSVPKCTQYSTGTGLTDSDCMSPFDELLLQSCWFPGEERPVKRSAMEAGRTGTLCLCRMPRVELPEDMSRQLARSGSGVINGTQGPGVAVYESPDGRDRADIYVGLLLDGLETYHNISAENSTIKMQFSVKPDLFCRPDDRLTYNPDTGRLLVVKVSIVSCACECETLSVCIVRDEI